LDAQKSGRLADRPRSADNAIPVFEKCQCDSEAISLEAPRGPAGKLWFLNDSMPKVGRLTSERVREFEQQFP
jgi:hypothetical protein